MIKLKRALCVVGLHSYQHSMTVRVKHGGRWNATERYVYCIDCHKTKRTL